MVFFNYYKGDNSYIYVWSTNYRSQLSDIQTAYAYKVYQVI